MDDLLLAARAKVHLIERHPRVKVAASGGVVRIGLEGASPGEQRAILDALGQIPGVKKIDIDVDPVKTSD